MEIKPRYVIWKIRLKSRKFYPIIFVRFFLFTHFDFSGLGKGMVSVPVMVLSTIDFKNWQDLKDLQK